MPRIPNVGNAKKDRLIGGETWTVVWLAPGTDIGLAVDERFRLEERFGLSNGTMFPEQGTALHPGNEEVKLKIIRDDDVNGFTYEGEIKFKNKKIMIWIQEGSAQATSEAEIWLSDPTVGVAGGPGGVAGIRR